MHLILVLALVHAVIFAFAFLLIGYTILTGWDAQELAALKDESLRAREQGWLSQWEVIAKHLQQFRSVSRLSAHWADRPDARKYIYIGLVFLVVAVMLGFPLGAYQ